LPRGTSAVPNAARMAQGVYFKRKTPNNTAAFALGMNVLRTSKRQRDDVGIIPAFGERRNV